MPNILVTGSNGQLGSELRELSTDYIHKYFFTDVSELDITDEENIKNFVEVNDIEIIVNCAAFTAVDKAENDTENAKNINHLAVKYLATISKEKNIKLIHISTDYVFDGENYKPYRETDVVNPQSVYGQTKLHGEEAMLEINPENSIIIRTSWVYSSFGSNFVKTMLRLGKEKDSLDVIYDQVGTPTYARDLAKTILEIIPKIKSDEVTIYHYANEGVSSWYDFAKAIFELSNVTCKVNAIETKDYPTPAKRPHYSVLNKSKIIKKYNLIIPYWKDSLNDCILKMREK